MIKKSWEQEKLIVGLAPQSQIAEQFRSIRTSLEFVADEIDMKVLVVTSSEQNSGKSLISANLALAYAQKGLKTLLIDADFRNPTIKHLFDLPQKRGLSSIIKRSRPYEEVISETNQNHLFVLLPGFIVANPVDMLGSSKMEALLKELRESFDQIIIDTPPILVATDAVVVSGFADGIVMIIRSGKTNKQTIKKAIRLVNQGTTPIVGTVLNDIKMSKSEYYYSDKLS